MSVLRREVTNLPAQQEQRNALLPARMALVLDFAANACSRFALILDSHTVFA